MTTAPTNVGPEAKQLAAEFDHHSSEQARARNQVLDTIREGCPVAHGEANGGYWLVTGFDAVEEVIQHPEIYSSRTVTVPAELFEGMGFPVLPPITLDGTEHRNFRRILLPAFSPRSIERFHEPIVASCHEFIDAFIAKGHCDGASDYARRVPIRTMSLVLGVPAADEDMFTSWIHRFVSTGMENPAGALEAAGELGPYLMTQLEEHRKNPKDDLLTTLIEANYEGERFTEDELFGFMFLMVNAGMDTVWSVLADSLWHLAQHPDQVAYLTEDLTRVPLAMEELLRAYSPAVLGRIVTQDTELGGCPIKAGESVLIGYPAANRDPNEFDRADEVVLDRSPNRHLGFGAGVHRCVGSTLARMELTAAMTAWLERIPEFSLADPDACKWGAGPVRGAKYIPITFRPGGGRG